MSEPLKRRVTAAQRRLLRELNHGGVWLIRCTLTDNYVLTDEVKGSTSRVYKKTAESVVREGWVAPDRAHPRRTALDVVYRITDSGIGKAGG